MRKSAQGAPAIPARQRRREDVADNEGARDEGARDEGARDGGAATESDGMSVGAGERGSSPAPVVASAAGATHGSLDDHAPAARHRDVLSDTTRGRRVGKPAGAQAGAQADSGAPLTAASIVAAISAPAVASAGGSGAASGDRLRVNGLVERVAQRQLRFTVGDVKAYAMSPDGQRLGLGLEQPDQLSRHLDAQVLAGTLAVVGRRLAWAYPEAPEGAPRNLRRVFVLRSHLHVHEHAPWDYDDHERAYLALCVACAATEATMVPTRAVTAVAACVPELMLDRAYTTRLWLDGLAALDMPLVELTHGVDAGTRWSRWRPFGRAPEDARFSGWVAAVRDRLAVTADPALAGAATRNEVLRELVLSTIKAHKDPGRWPRGRAVTAREILTHVASNPALNVRAAVLKLTERGIGPVLGDASRTRIAGQQRKTPVIVKAGAVPGRQPYYDVPDHPGSEARQLVVAVETLKATVHRGTSRRVLREVNAAQPLFVSGRGAAPNSSDAVLGAIGAVRLVAVYRELDDSQALVDMLTGASHLLGRFVREEIHGHATLVRELRSDIAHLSGGITSLPQARSAAEAALLGLGLSLNAVEGASRCVLSATQVQALVPAGLAASPDRTAASLLADMKELRRFPLPSSASGRRGGLVATGVDRVDAVVYLAKRSASRALLFLSDGASLLGPGLRDPNLIRLLLTRAAAERPTRSAVSRWITALAALALLDDPAAAAAASAELATAATHGATEPALWTALLTRSFREGALPARIRHDPTPAVRAAIRSATTAARLGRVFP